jgi:hypothetical protein
MIKNWFLFGLFIRILCAATNMRVGHPDQWYQTLEFANFMQNGFMSYSLEDAHLRNLSYPMFFRIPFFFAQFVSDIPWMKLFFSKLFIGLVNLFVIIWFVLRLIQHYDIRSKKIQTLIFSLFLFMGFMISDSVHTSIEHASILIMLSIIALMFSPLGRSTSYSLGLLLVLLGAIRYPSLLFSVGVLSALSLQFFQKEKLKLSYLYLLFGLFSGLFLFGLSDWIYYGRPWESLWMYLQFNLFTNLSHTIYGEQSANIYLEYVWREFGHIRIFWGLPLLSFGIVSIGIGVKQYQPWAWGTLFYILGHLVPAHKEDRFINPIIPILIFAAIIEAWKRRDSFRKLSTSRWKNLIVALVVFGFVENGIRVLEILRGDLFKSRTEFVLAQELAYKEKPCAFLSEFSPPSMLLRGTLSLFPKIPTSYFDKVSKDSLKEAHLYWYGRRAECNSTDKIFVHLDKDKNELQEICTRKEIYSSSMVQNVSKLFKGSTLYECPSILFKDLFATSSLDILSYSLKHHEKLPDFGISGRKFLEETGVRTTDKWDWLKE